MYVITWMALFFDEFHHVPELESPLKTVGIKSASTLNTRWFQGGEKLEKLKNVKKYVVYNGPTTETENATALNFGDLDRLLEE